MKKYLVLTFLLLTTSYTNLFAEWKYLVSNEANDEFYADFSSRKVNNSLVKIWIMTKINKPTTEGDLASKVLKEFDCENDLVRNQYMIFYSDREMSKITSNFSAHNKEWVPILPDSVMSYLMKQVCVR